MNVITNDQDRADEDILVFEVSDEELEAAGDGWDNNYTYNRTAFPAGGTC